MKRISLDREWEFSKEAPAYYFPMQGMSAGKQIVNLPHDANISEDVSPDCPDGKSNAFYKGICGVYTKYIDISEEDKGKYIFLELDGAYCNTEITLNGHQIAIHPNGYAPFSCELTKYIKYGAKNRLSIFVNHSMGRTSRWYAGTGIYRHADLRIGGGVHLTVDPIFGFTERVENNTAFVTVEVEAENRTNVTKKILAKVGLYKDSGHNKPCSKSAAAEEESIIQLPPNSVCKAKVRLVVDNPEIWDIDNPALYQIKAELFDGGYRLDEDSVLFGIRTMTIDTKNGFMLNGRQIKIKGGCVHHDNGILGAASFYDSEYRRMKLHKDNGFNGIRCAHNPMSRDMMEVCDRLGLLVFAEAFDMWNMHKSINDYHSFFSEWWERDLVALIKRDRNHPSVFCWSIGNEIVERNGLSEGVEWCKKLALKAKEFDPTRVVTSAMPTLFIGLEDNDTMSLLKSLQSLGPVQNFSTPWSEESWDDRTEAFCAPLDIVGYNYLEDRYDSDTKKHPERIICGTESYPDRIDVIWDIVEKIPQVIGDFVWVSYDYLGESGVGQIKYRDSSQPKVSVMEMHSVSFPYRTANCGGFDINGNDLPSLHYRKIVWGSGETYISVLSPKNYGKEANKAKWAWEECDNVWYYPDYENKPVKIEIYSAAEEVELIINGKSLGRKSAGKKNYYKAVFDTVYSAGTAKAISFNSGKAVSEQTLTTPGKPEKIILMPDKKEMLADGQSLIFVKVLITDKDGNIIPDAVEKLKANVSGEASLAAFGSSNPVTDENYTTGSFTTYKGSLLAILRAGFASGKAKLTVESENYGNAEIEITLIN